MTGEANAAFLCALGLAGWSEQSVLGWDPDDAVWWAQLWRNGSVTDKPDIWLGYVPPIPTVAGLIEQIATRTAMAVNEVGEAVNEAVAQR